MTESFENISCNYCHTSNEDFISNKGQFGLPINVVICKNCGLSYLNPRWTKATYLGFYRHHYDKYYRPNLGKEDSLKEPNPIFHRMQKLNLSPKKILDIGSGAGGNLRYLQTKFPDSEFFSIEPSNAAQEILTKHQITIVANDVDSNWEKEFQNTFDFIIMRHVLEHFSDPCAILKKVATCLKSDGILYIAVPNCLNPTTPLQTNWFRVVHTYYFNRYTLSNLLTINEFTPIEMVEGDRFNRGELYAFIKKGTTLPSSNNKEAYEKQKAVYETRLKQENKIWPTFRRELKLFRIRRKLAML